MNDIRINHSISRARLEAAALGVAAIIVFFVLIFLTIPVVRITSKPTTCYLSYASLILSLNVDNLCKSMQWWFFLFITLVIIMVFLPAIMCMKTKKNV